MRVKAHNLNRLYFFWTVSRTELSSFPPHKTLKPWFFSSFPANSKTLQHPCKSHSQALPDEQFSPEQCPTVKTGIDNFSVSFKKYGFSDEDISKILCRQPSIFKFDLNNLQSKLQILQDLGLIGSDLVKIISCRPRILTNPLEKELAERVEFLLALFGSKQTTFKVLTRNPSLLTYELDKMKHCVALYEEMDIPKQDLAGLLVSRPMLIPRSSITKEKVEYLQKIGIPKESNMYKYAVSLIASSRLETIQEKVTNLEKFGFSFKEVTKLFHRSPYTFTLSVQKVQRNMTYIITTMKLPASIVLDYPFLLTCNLVKWLKPRFILSEKIHSMDLSPQIKGPLMMRALKMAEPRFLKAFVACHEKDIAELLMDVYMEAKSAKQLAESSWMWQRAKGSTREKVP